MKMKFTYLFVASSWIIFFATGRSIAGSILLALAGAYMLADILVKIWNK